ncbi:MAG TPA: hypothetical protein DIU00_14180 [Phycisphaerales bacterium]|nr:hypothetical protein [Phycisphaerales bacterium]
MMLLFFKLIFEPERAGRGAAVVLPSGLAGVDIIRRDSVVQEFPAGQNANVRKFHWHCEANQCIMMVWRLNDLVKRRWPGGISRCVVICFEEAEYISNRNFLMQ